MSAAIKKLEGVESVEVSLEKGSIDVRLKADNQVTLPLLRRTIRSNGNETKAAQIAGRGRIVDTDGKRLLDLLNGATMEVEPGSNAAPGGVVEITGVSVESARGVERVKITEIK